MSLADAIRTVTAKVQLELSRGRRSGQIDAYDLVDILLEIAEQVDTETYPATQPAASGYHGRACATGAATLPSSG